MSDFLTTMTSQSHARVAEAKRRASEAVLRARSSDLPAPRTLALHPGGFDLIAEVKRSSPSAGRLAGNTAGNAEFVALQADAYARGGAAAVSVLTESERFGGSLEDLTVAARAVRLPVMRKDFLVDPYQVWEARAAGAAGILIIARILDDTRLREMLDVTAELGMFALIEAFDEDDLARTHDFVGYSTIEGMQLLVGLNVRNLATLEVDRERLRSHASTFPSGVPRVAESGMRTSDDVRDAAALCYQVALVGSALMQAENPAKLVAEMVEAGRTEAMKEECASA